MATIKGKTGQSAYKHAAKISKLVVVVDLVQRAMVEMADGARSSELSGSTSPHEGPLLATMYRLPEVERSHLKERLPSIKDE